MNLEELTDCVYDYGCECISTTTKVIMDNVALCIRDAVLAEREACAKICDDLACDKDHVHPVECAANIIRARK